MKEDKIPDRSTQFLANERTFLAWLRTSLALIGLGFVVSRFGLFLRELGIRTQESIIARPSIHSHSSLLGISMVFLGAALIIYALKNYFVSYAIYIYIIVIQTLLEFLLAVIN